MAVKSSTRASRRGFGEPSEVLSQRFSLEEWSRIGLGSLQKSSHKDPLYKSGFNGLQPSSFFFFFSLRVSLCVLVCSVVVVVLL